MLTVTHNTSVVESYLGLYLPRGSYSIYVGKWVTRLSQLPSSSQLFIHFLAKLGELFSWVTKTKGDSPNLVILLWWLGHLLHINTFGSAIPRVNSVKVRWTERARVRLAQAKGTAFFSYRPSLKLTRLGGWPSLALTGFLHFKPGLVIMSIKQKRNACLAVWCFEWEGVFCYVEFLCATILGTLSLLSLVFTKLKTHP